MQIEKVHKLIGRVNSLNVAIAEKDWWRAGTTAREILKRIPEHYPSRLACVMFDITTGDIDQASRNCE